MIQVHCLRRLVSQLREHTTKVDPMKKCSPFSVHFFPHSFSGQFCAPANFTVTRCTLCLAEFISIFSPRPFESHNTLGDIILGQLVGEKVRSDWSLQPQPKLDPSTDRPNGHSSQPFDLWTKQNPTLAHFRDDNSVGG